MEALAYDNKISAKMQDGQRNQYNRSKSVVAAGKMIRIVVESLCKDKRPPLRNSDSGTSMLKKCLEVWRCHIHVW